MGMCGGKRFVDAWQVEAGGADESEPRLLQRLAQARPRDEFVDDDVVLRIPLGAHFLDRLEHGVW